MSSFLRKTVQGLVIVLPLVVTVWVIVWLGGVVEGLSAPWLEKLLGAAPTPPDPNPDPGLLGIKRIHYVPGMGIIVGLVLAIVVGRLARFWLVDRVVQWFGNMLQKIPLVKTLYGSISDLMGFMGTGQKKAFTRVVLVRVPETQMKVIGFVTRESFDEIEGLSQLTGRVAVYVSQSYNIGGLTMLVPREDVEDIDMTIEDAMRFSLTGGVSVEERALPPSLQKAMEKSGQSAGGAADE